MQLHARAHHRHPSDSSAHPVSVPKGNRHPKSPSRQANKAALPGGPGSAAPRYSSRRRRPTASPVTFGRGAGQGRPYSLRSAGQGWVGQGPPRAAPSPGQAAGTGRGGRASPRLWQRPSLRARPGRGRDPATSRTEPPVSGGVAATQCHSLAPGPPPAAPLTSGTASSPPGPGTAPAVPRSIASPRSLRLVRPRSPPPQPQRQPRSAACRRGTAPRPRSVAAPAALRASEGTVLAGQRRSSLIHVFNQHSPPLIEAARAPLPGPLA